jgi:hypothetical protein
MRFRGKGEGHMSKQPLNWRKLPSHLCYLAGPAEKYGGYQFDDRIYDYLTNDMTEQDRVELRTVAERIESDSAEIEAWLDDYNMTVHDEAGLIYFLHHFIALANDGNFLD